MSRRTEQVGRFPRQVVVAVTGVLLLALSGTGIFALRSAQGAQEIVVGVIATGPGTFEAAGQDAFRGLDLAVDKFGAEVSGKSIRVVKKETDGTPEGALVAARDLVEDDGADVIIGPLTDDEGLRLKTYAKTVPSTTFIIGSAGAQELTLSDPVANLFRFGTDAVQWQAGLGSFAYHDLGYRRIVVVAEDASYPYAQVGGFMTEFCNAGGHVPEKVWVAPGTQDFTAVVAQIPTAVNAIFVALDSQDTLAFLTAYDAAGGTAPIIAGAGSLDATVLSATGTVRERLIGVPSASAVVDVNAEPAWNEFVADYVAAYPDADSPSAYSYFYYTAAQAALLAFEQVDGNLGSDQTKLKDALSTLAFSSPTGPVRLDRNRQAVTNVFVTVVDVDANGSLYHKIVRVMPNVNQTLGFPEMKFLAQGQFNRDSPSCV
jgi:branched-chain amino acid transport system substrate-binding protein